MTDLRPIEIGGRAGVVPAPQALPELRWLPVAELRIDGRYQRPLGEKNWRAIQRIAEAFDWTRFTPLLVAPVAPGVYAVIDGQHRVHAAMLCGFPQVPCMVVAADVAGQAASFAAVNGNVVRMSPLNLYRAALAAGETWAEQCHLAVDRAGCVLRTVNMSTAHKKPGEVYCVALIRALVTGGRSEAVTAGLAAIHGLRGGPGNYTDAVLAPWLRALSDEWRLLDRVDLGAALRRHGIAKVMGRADHARATGAMTGSAEGVRRQVWRELLRAEAGGAVPAPAAPVRPAPAVPVSPAPGSFARPAPVEAPPAPAATGAGGVPAALEEAGDYARWLRGEPCPAPWTPALDWQLARDVAAGAGFSRVARAAGVRLSDANARWLALTAPLREGGTLTPARQGLALSAIKARATEGVAA